ncbi:MAG TPA: hypothetical protein V6D05_17150 [Stenomitos sp.]
MVPKAFLLASLALLWLTQPAYAFPHTEVTGIDYSAHEAALIIRYRGARPATTTFRLIPDQQLVVDLGRSGSLGLPRRIIRPTASPLVRRVRFAQRPHRVVRIAFDCKRRLGLEILDRPGMILLRPYALPRQPAHRRPLTRRLPLPPAPVPAKPKPSPLPQASASPEPTPAPLPPATTSPEPSPAPLLQATASPEPTPGPRSHPAPSARVGIEVLSASYLETYVPGDAMVIVEGLDGLQGFVEWAVREDVRSAVRISRWAYGFEDRYLPMSAHFRTEWQGELEAAWHHPMGAWSWSLGGAYGARWVQTNSTGAAPAPSFVFAPNQLYHGPALTFAMDWRPVAGWEANARLSVTPWLFGSVDLGGSLPTLHAGTWDVGLARSFGDTKAQVGIRGWQSFGDQFDVRTSAVYLGLSH